MLTALYLVKYILSFINTKTGDIAMKWETPEYNDIRFGFEVTMYINNK
jgi:coenzyme PQQ precursor peptide PqqA